MGVQIAQLARTFAGVEIADASYFHLQLLGEDMVYRDYKLRGDKLKTLLQPFRTELARIEVNAADVTCTPVVDIGAKLGDYFNLKHDAVTDANNVVTSLGVAAAGVTRTLRCDGGLTFTHDAVSLILPSGIPYVTRDGDIICFRSLGAGHWQCINFSGFDGQGMLACFEVRNCFSEIGGPGDDALRIAAHVNLGLRIGNDAFAGDVLKYTDVLGALTDANTMGQLRVILGLAIGEDVLAFVNEATPDELRTCLVTALRTFSPRDVVRPLPRMGVTGMPRYIVNKIRLQGQFALYNNDGAGFSALSLSGAPTAEALELGLTFVGSAVTNQYVLRCVDGQYRFDDYGNFQLWNTTQGRYHTFTLSGPSEGVVYNIAAADPDYAGRQGFALIEVPGKYRFTYSGDFQLWNNDTQAFHTFSIGGAAGAEVPNFSASDNSFL